MRLIGLFLFVLVFLPLLAFGQVIPEYRPLEPGEWEFGSAESAIRGFGGRIAEIIGTLILAIAVIMILFAAFGFLTAGGDAEKVTAARNTLVYALVGVAVATLAFVLPGLVTNLLRGIGS